MHAEPAATEAELREQRYSLTVGRGLRATGHTATDQVETVVYRLVSSGSTRGIRPRRADGVVRPLLDVWREETEAYCRAHGLTWRVDATNADTKRGLIRERLLPLLEELDPRARANLLALASERPRLPRALEASLVELLSSSEGTRAADLGGGVRAVRAYDTLRLEGSRDVGAVAGSRPTGPASSSGRAGRAIVSRVAPVRFTMCSWMPRCRGTSATPGRSSQPRTAIVVAVVGLEEAPGWEGAVRAERVPE